MAKITLRIDADTSSVSAAIANLKKDVAALSAIKINLGGLDASAFTRAENAAAKATNALARQAAAEAKLAAEERKLQTEKEKTARATINANSKTEQSEARAALSAQKHGEKMEEIAAKTSAATSATNSATSAFNALSVALGNIAARAFHLVVAKITQGIREAVTEMKNVDTQLTNISKVSGITGDELEAMGERAYETALKYGVAADEYLSAVYTFQKAGLNDSADAMGELAVKTMLVGDTTAEVASKFLISANAAWQMGGDIERLSQVVDEADYINNNYATDLGKLSEGLPRVASVAAQAGMSVEETLAAIGTITAVTQETGTKSATALRALILNIEGQIGEFVDDTGETFTVTEESVKSMQGLMEKYAKAELDAAKASGELINPMTAIKAIFEGMANSDLNDQELFQLLSGMGGKLRTNQLTALVQNYEMFDDMLGKIANSAGTADNEVSLMMESWEKKTQNLKTTWTKFVSDITSTSTFKKAIDDLTQTISGFDQELNETKNPFYISEQTLSAYNTLKQEYDELLKQGNALNETEQSRLAYLEAELQLLLEQQRVENEAAAQKLQNRLTDYSFINGKRKDQNNWEDLQYLYNNIQWTGKADEFQASLKKIVDQYQEVYDKTIQVRDAGISLTSEQEQFIDYFEGISAAAQAQGLYVDGLANGYYRLVDAQGNVLAYTKDRTEEINQETEAIRKQEEEQRKAAERAAEEQRKAAEEQAALQQAFGTEGPYVQEDYDQIQASMARLRGDAEDLASAEQDVAVAAQNIVTNTDEIDFSEAADSAEELQGSTEAVAEETVDMAQAVEEAWQKFQDASAAFEEVSKQYHDQYDESGFFGKRALKSELDEAIAAVDEARNEYNRLKNEASGVTESEEEAADAASEVAESASGISFASAIAGAARLAAILAGLPGLAGLGLSGLGIGGHAGGTPSAKGGPTLVNELGPELISENGKAYIANGGRPGIVNLSKGAIVLPANVTKDAIRGGRPTQIINAASSGRKKGTAPGSQYTDPTSYGSTRESTDPAAWRHVVETARHRPYDPGLGDQGTQLPPGYKHDWTCPKCGTVNVGQRTTCYKCGAKKPGGPSSGGGGRGGKSKKEKAEEAAKKLAEKLTNIDKRATLAHTEERYEDEKSLYRRAIRLIKKQLNVYKKAGFKNTSNEVVDLKNKIHDYESKLESVNKTQWDADIEARQAEIEERRKKEEMQSKEEAAEKARIALENAKNQRNVRMFNAETGQWEWIADQGAIDKAQQQYDSAQEALLRAQEDAELQALRDRRDSGEAYQTPTLGEVGEATSEPVSEVVKNASAAGTEFAQSQGLVFGGAPAASGGAATKSGAVSTDSHDTIYNFGNITMGEAEAESTSVAELAKKLSVLKIS